MKKEDIILLDCNNCKTHLGITNSDIQYNNGFYVKCIKCNNEIYFTDYQINLYKLRRLRSIIFLVWLKELLIGTCRIYELIV